jgi:signal transduction histidine kinase/ActR/RegA family two-component response regulator
MKDAHKSKEQLIEELQALRLQSEQEIAKLTHDLSLCQAILDESGQVVYVKKATDQTHVLVNKAFSEIISSEDGLIVGKTSRQLFGDEIGAEFDDTHARVVAGERVELEETIGHQIYWTHSFGLTLPGGERFVCGITTDITQRQKAEPRLKRNQGLLADVLNALPVGVAVMKGDDFEYTHVNKFIAKFNGKSVEQHIGSSVNELVHPAVVDNAVANLRQVRSSGVGIPQRELQVPLPNGELRDILDFHFPLPLHDSVLAVVVDITEKRKLDRQLKHAQKMEAIGVLTGGIAHEFNNLLSPILGFTELLISSKAQGDQDIKRLEQIQKAGNRAKLLVQQMLAYGRKSMTQTEIVELEPLVEETINLTKNTIPSNIKITKAFEVDLPPILGMHNELEQVILNLIVNASHAMEQGGTLTIGLKRAYGHSYTIDGKSCEGDFVALSVADSGTGMDRDTLDCIFDPFFTTKSIGSGSGLGLSVVQGIVAQHQGHIKVESTPGAGSAFHVYFPAQEVKPTPIEIEQLSSFGGNEHILLVDDEQMITELTSEILEVVGYKVTVFHDSLDALKCFASQPQTFDLVLTDYDMPKMNGKQLAEQLINVRDDIPMILFTGYADLIAKEDINQWGMDALLIKPFDMKELTELVRRVLNRKA